MSKRKTLDMWIDEAFKDRDKELPCTQLTLVVMIAMQEKELHTVRLNPGHTLAPKELADLFIGKAITYGQDLPGTQTYQVLAFYKDRKEPEARYPFVPQIPTDIRSTGLTTEAPTAQGALQQEMRIKDQWMGLVFQRQRQMDQTAIEREERDAARAREDRQYIRELQQENRECFAVVKETMMMLADTQHEKKMKQLEFARATEERKKWLSFGPVLINQLLGKEIFPQNVEDTALIEAVAENIPEEQIKLLGSVLPPQLWGPLSARLERAMREKRETQEAIAALPAGDPNAELGNKAAE